MRLSTCWPPTVASSGGLNEASSTFSRLTSFMYHSSRGMAGAAGSGVLSDTGADALSDTACDALTELDAGRLGSLWSESRKNRK